MLFPSQPELFLFILINLFPCASSIIITASYLKFQYPAAKNSFRLHILLPVLYNWAERIEKYGYPLLHIRKDIPDSLMNNSYLL